MVIAEDAQLARSAGSARNSSNRARWTVNPRYRELVGDGDPISWIDLEHVPGAELVKVGRGRKVWRVLHNGATIYAKVYDAPRGIERIGWALLGSPARREWRVLTRAEALGLPTVAAVGVGDDRLARRSALLTLGVNGAETLAGCWERLSALPSQSARRAGISAATTAVVRLMIAAHERGVVPRDNHPNNILLRASTEGTLDARFVDLHGAWFRHAGERRSLPVKALAQLDHYFRYSATRVQRLRALRDYLIAAAHGQAKSVDLHSALREAVRRISAARREHANRLARRRDRRLSGDGKYFGRIELPGGWCGLVVLKLARRRAFDEGTIPDRTETEWRELLAPIMSALDRVPSTFEQRTVSIDRRAGFARHSLQALTAGEARPTGFTEDAVYLEAVSTSSFARSVLWGLRGSPFRQRFYASHRDRHRDLPHDLQLAYLEKRRRGAVVAAIAIRCAGPGEWS